MCISGLSRVFPCTRAKRSIPAGSGCAPETEFQFSGIPRGQGRSRRGGPHQFAIGPSIQLYLKPLIRLKNTTILDLDDTRSRFLVLETGYRYLTAPGAAPENRMLTAVTFNLPLAAGIRLSDRNRADLDWKNGIFTWRYRNKLSLGRTFAIRSDHFIPYVAAEPCYESQYGRWSTTALYVGSLSPVRKHVQFNSYFEHENNTGKHPNQRVNAVGLALCVYFSLEK
jgi:hypothetical protein